MLIALAANGAAASTVFDVARDGGVYHVRASAALAADLHIAWQTITDYESLPQIVADLTHSTVLARQPEGSGERLLVRQHGALRFLFFAQKVSVLLEVQHDPPLRVRARALPASPADADEAPVTEFEGTYELAPLADGVQLTYRARFAPTFALPPLLGTLAVRQTMQRNFEALAAEIVRRQRALRRTSR
ncbi:MAG: SRPBCC family protein [Burkholderiaceae bacterium]|nr:SRPBCC family protein [Burkholderiaceae bacterium]MCX8003539.1 SRPBCC family protein [Burkholderiaceae bacterium]